VGGGAPGRVPLSQRGARQSTTNTAQHKFVGPGAGQGGHPQPNQAAGPEGTPAKGMPVSASQPHPMASGRRQGHRNQLVAQSLNVRNQYSGVGGSGQLFAANGEKGMQFGLSGPIATRAGGDNRLATSP